MLSVLVFLPAAAGVLCLLLPKSAEQNAKYVALLGSLAALAISIVMFFQFDLHKTGFQFEESQKWIDFAGFELRYHLGVDGLSMPLVILTTFLILSSQ